MLSKFLDRKPKPQGESNQKTTIELKTPAFTAATQKLQINVDNVTDLHPGVWGNFKNISGSVANITGDVSGLSGFVGNNSGCATNIIGNVQVYPGNLETIAEKPSAIKLK